MNVAERRPVSTAESRSQYLSFSLGSEDYAIEILRVQEIRPMCPMTALPYAPSHVRGVMNLRGAVVPVIDTRMALGLARNEYGSSTVIIVVSAFDRTIGFVVDRVSDVLAIDDSDVERTPDIRGRADVSMISGIARAQERFVVLLDIERVVGGSVADLDVR